MTTLFRGFLPANGTGARYRLRNDNYLRGMSMVCFFRQWSCGGRGESGSRARSSV
ncbi:MAG: hypothetical protein ACYC49_17885 [Ignavibacteriaceae bacterium]